MERFKVVDAKTVRFFDQNTGQEVELMMVFDMVALEVKPGEVSPERNSPLGEMFYFLSHGPRKPTRGNNVSG